ncbi:hypothetical protein B0H14DRAFT_2614278 [Mycena olivaceomarginata]|nr:hypothetical protein B0H14DRAFT_2614278 [Mycena olivaceomarginata]
MQLHVDLLTQRLTKKGKVQQDSVPGRQQISKRLKAGTIQGKGLDAPNAFRMTLETTRLLATPQKLLSKSKTKKQGHLECDEQPERAVALSRAVRMHVILVEIKVNPAANNLYCDHCPDGKGRVDCCEVLWPFRQTERLRGLAAGFNIGGNGGRQSSWCTTTTITKRKHSCGGTPKPLGTLLVFQKSMMVVGSYGSESRRWRDFSQQREVRNFDKVSFIALPKQRSKGLGSVSLATGGTTFRGRLDSLSQGSAISVQISVGAYRFIVVVKEAMQSCESLIGIITVIISNRRVADTSRDTAPGRVATRLISCSLTSMYQSRHDPLSEPKLAAATKRKDYKSFSHLISGGQQHLD